MISQLHYIEYLHFHVGSVEIDIPVTTRQMGMQRGVQGDIKDSEIFSEESSTMGNAVTLEPSDKAVALDAIQTCISGHVTKEMIDQAIHIFRHCKTTLSPNGAKENDVGLETLPGQLIPFPEVEEMRNVTESINNNKTGTKDMRQNQPYDRPFIVNTIYTKPTIARAVATLFIQLVKGQHDHMGVVDCGHQDTLWVDAGSGSGELLHHFPETNRIGIDIHPSSSEVYEMDYFQVTREWLFRQSPAKGKSCEITDLTSKPVCVISNPPFSEQSRGDYVPIVSFINHSVSALRASYIGVIVPVQFCRQRIWKSLGLDSRVHLLSRCFLPIDSFYDPSVSGTVNDDGKHATASTKTSTVGIKSMFLFFAVNYGDNPNTHCDAGIKPLDMRRNEFPSTDDTKILKKEYSIYVVGKRNKGDFPWLTTNEFTNCVVRGLHDGKGGIQLGLEMESECVVNANASRITESSLPASKKRKKIAHLNPSQTKMNIDFSVCLNPKQPLSLMNCECSSIPNHSLGWLSSSVRPPLARAMCSLAISEKEVLREDGILADTNDSKFKAKAKQSPTKAAPVEIGAFPANKVFASLVVNTMCGEGTIEIESTSLSSNCPFFMISGDLNVSSLKRTIDRLTTLRQKTTPRSVSNSKPLEIDFVLWDAQRLPLRGDIVDFVLADLPFMGSTKTAHQIPTATETLIVKADESSPPLTSQRQKHSTTPTLNYQKVLTESCRILQNCNAANIGRAAFVSADSKALSHAVTKCQHRWNILWKQGVNIGGLQGKLFLLERKPPPFKDLSFWVLADSFTGDSDSLTTARTENSVFTTGMSSFIFSKALAACSKYLMDTKSMELTIKPTGKCHESQEGTMNGDEMPLITKVEKVDEFYHPTKKLWTHCYRLWFDGCLLDSQAKRLEKDIRSAVLENLPKGFELR